MITQFKIYENTNDNEILNFISDYILDYVDIEEDRYFDGNGDKVWYSKIDDHSIEFTAKQIIIFFKQIDNSLENDTWKDIAHCLENLEINDKTQNITLQSVDKVSSEIFDILDYEIEDLIDKYNIHQQTTKYNL